MSDATVATRLEMRWVPVLDARGRARLEARWSDPTTQAAATTDRPRVTHAA